MNINFTEIPAYQKDDLNEFIKILRCPVSGNDLKWATGKPGMLIEKIKNSGTVYPLDSILVQDEFTLWLVDNTNRYYYPVVKEIIFLHKDYALSDEKAYNSVSLSAIDESIKESNRIFYNKQGWTESEGDFEDAVLFEDLRDISFDYRKNCHERLTRYIGDGGKYILDVASGPVQYDEYLQYSENFEKRICMDLSIKALIQARKKLGNKGIYVLGDITNLPFKENSIDCTLSLHTIYHVPKKEQVKAFDELVRVVKQGRNAIIVYSWGYNSLLMNTFFLPKKVVRILKVLILRILNLGRSSEQIENTSRGLYFYSFPYNKLLNALPYKCDIKVWRSVDVPFLKLFIHRGFFGSKILKWIYNHEEKNPGFFGRVGQYPLFIIHKQNIN